MTAHHRATMTACYSAMALAAALFGIPAAKETPVDDDLILDASQVVELRQYTLHPGKRDTLVELFDGRFVEPQEAAGMRVLGQFRDLDRPDLFVWLRGFPDLPSRGSRLNAFYGGPVWKANREAANATMVDSDNVLLLRPVDPGSGLLLPLARQEAPPTQETGFVLLTVYLLRVPVDEAFLQLFAQRITPLMASTGAPPLARYQTEYGRNDFPKLPIREGENAFVWATSFASQADYDRHRAELAALGAWKGSAEPALKQVLKSAPQELRLAPTARSLLRHREPLGYTLNRTGQVHDFDFIAGEWKVASRRLKVRAVGSTDWEEFPGTSRAALHLGGVANADEFTFPTRGSSGMTIRSFNLATRQWTIRWISSKTGTLDPGVVGGFAGDRGEFYGEDEDAGQRVKVRFVWTRLSPDTARWEQAFSYGGRPWETNWIMSFTREKR